MQIYFASHYYEYDFLMDFIYSYSRVPAKILALLNKMIMFIKANFRNINDNYNLNTFIF